MDIEIIKVIGDLRNENNRLRLLRIGKSKAEKAAINKQIASNIIEIKKLRKQKK